MTFFDKTLDEILDIITDVNEQIYNQVNIDGDAPSIAITFEFCEFWAAFKMNELDLFNTENDPRLYDEDTDEYEDLTLALPRIINEKLDTFKTIQL